MSVFSLEQLQALALLFLKVNDHGAAIALVFFGFYPYIAALGLLGAASLILWLLVFGVNEQRWKEQASAARSSDA